jgi:hypothetical protein
MQQHITLWKGHERKVVLAGIATIQWQTANSALCTPPRFRDYMMDLVRWARREASSASDASESLEVSSSHVRFGRGMIAKFLYIREPQLTMILFLNDLLREPDQPALDFIEMRH